MMQFHYLILFLATSFYACNSASKAETVVGNTDLTVIQDTVIKPHSDSLKKQLQQSNSLTKDDKYTSFERTSIEANLKEKMAVSYD